MTDKPHEHDEATTDDVAQPDGEDVSADELAGEETEPEHDADPSRFAEATEDDEGDDGALARVARLLAVSPLALSARLPEVGTNG